MAGNVLEWVFDVYLCDYYNNSLGSNPFGPGPRKLLAGFNLDRFGQNENFVSRGGSYRCPRSFAKLLFGVGRLVNLIHITACNRSVFGLPVRSPVTISEYQGHLIYSQPNWSACLSVQFLAS